MTQRRSALPRFIMLLTACCSCLARGKELFVAPDGSDTNLGTAAQPLAGIRKALERVAPGDTITLKGGVYREEIELPRSGTAAFPITIRGYGLDVVEISGLEPVKSAWALVDKDKSIWSTKTTGPLSAENLGTELVENNYQVFMDGKSMLAARWPNCRYAELLSRKAWHKSGKDAQYGFFNVPELKGSSWDIEGADIYLNVIHQFFTWRRPVTTFDPATGRIGYPKDLSIPPLFMTHKYYATKGWMDDCFYLQGKKDFLDYEGEFFFDKDANELFIIPAPGVNPNQAAVEVKTRLYGLSGTNTSHVTLKNLNFLGCAMNLQDCNHIELTDSTFRYPVNQQEVEETVLEKYDTGRPLQYPSVKNVISGDDNVLRNIYVGYAATTGLNLMGNRPLLENAIVHDACYSGSLYYNALKLSYKFDEGTIRRATVFNAGNVGVHLQNRGFLLELSHVYNAGMISHDVSAVYTRIRWKGSRPPRITRNWVHDNPSPTGSIGIRGDDLCRELTIDHNVVWNASTGIVAKGDKNAVCNNTAIGMDEPIGNSIGIRLVKRPEPRKRDQVDQGAEFLDVQNAHSFYYNNLVESESSSKKKGGEPIQCKSIGDSYVMGETMPLQDPWNYNFKPSADFKEELKGKPYADGMILPIAMDPSSKQPYKGAYGFDGNDWKPGHINGIKFLLTAPSDTPQLTVRYLLPLIKNDTLTVSINGKKMKTMENSPQSSFGTYILPAMAINDIRQITFASERFGTVTYDLNNGAYDTVYRISFKEEDLFRNETTTLRKEYARK